MANGFNQYSLKLAFQRIKGCDLDLEKRVLTCYCAATTRPLCQAVKPEWFNNVMHRKAFLWLRAATSGDKAAEAKALLLCRKLQVGPHCGVITNEKCEEHVNGLRRAFLRRRTQQLAEWLWERAGCDPADFLTYMDKGAERLRKEMQANGLEQRAEPVPG